MPHTNYKQMIESDFNEFWYKIIDMSDKSNKERDRIKQFLKSSYIKSLNNEIEYLESKKYTFKKVDWGDGIITDENVEDETICLAEAQGFNRALQDHISHLQSELKAIEEE